MVASTLTSLCITRSPWNCSWGNTCLKFQRISGVARLAKSLYDYRSWNVTKLHMVHWQQLQCSSTKAGTIEDGKFTRVYKLKNVRYVRLISRFKIYQTFGAALICIPLTYGYTCGTVSLHTLLSAGFGLTAASTLLGIYSYFAMKLIGEMQLSKSSREVRFSTLDFLGRRRDFIIPLESIITAEIDPSTSPENMNVLYSKLEYEDEEGHLKMLYYSLRWGIVYERKSFGIIAGSVNNEVRRTSEDANN